MFGKMRQMFVSSHNDDGDNCDTCHGEFVSGTDKWETRGNSELHVKKLKCAMGHVSDRTTDGG